MNSSIEIELQELRQENHRLRLRVERLLQGRYPERGTEKTLRDEFAMAAMRGLVSFITEPNTTAQTVGAAAYKIADAMLEARK